ncbi:Carbohydrate sulfotransferase 1 [Amphibalanus amphitrite]|uniref:Carbohydrate sulfotransferase 1 n=1 Tax=Amphibalanus amphitrite TaxID=1232801 RepID=A0A6A4V3A4_AMPAM|nr:Carbohydrate sulfotransferase 1 [Amphibalanus amphitrite]
MGRLRRCSVAALLLALITLLSLLLSSRRLLDRRTPVAPDDRVPLNRLLTVGLTATAGGLLTDTVRPGGAFAEEMAKLYEVRRRKAIARNRPANASEISAALRLLQLQLDTESGQLPDQLPPPVFLATTWRSGSTFLGHVLSAPAGVFTHYEPLSALGRGPNRNACTNEAFLSAACRLLPLHVFKLVRLRLRELEPQLRAGARVVYLVRDPRATLSSRLSSVRWCRRSDECVQPARLCADIEDDLAALRELQARFPAGLRLVRYEQLATQPRRQLRDIFEFVSFRWSAEVDRIVDESTRSGTESSEPWSVLKNSAEHVDRWKERLSPKQIDYINRKCQRVIQQLGYNV